MKAGLIPHIPDEPLVMIRLCYLKICDNDACEAALLDYAAMKNKGEWWAATFGELEAALLYCWGRSKIIVSVKSLIARGLLERRYNPEVKTDRTWQYRLSVTAVSALDEIHREVSHV